MSDSTEAELRELVAAQAELIERLTARVAELERRLGADSSNSSRPPSSDPPWSKKPAKPRSSRERSGRKPGKQPGDPAVSRSLSDNPDRIVAIAPGHCSGCTRSLTGAPATVSEGRQVVDLTGAGPGDHRVPAAGQDLRLLRCGHHADWTAADDLNAQVVAPAGSPVRIRPARWPGARC